MRGIPKNRWCCPIPRWMVILATIVVFATISFSQNPVGTVTGTVTDESGAVIPGASVTVRSKATGAERKLETGSDGTYSAAALPAGEYEVDISSKGFKTLKASVTVTTGSVITVDGNMKIGQAAETVEVTSAGATVNYETHSIDGVITRNKIQELPLNGRSFLQLAFLEPGVSASPGTTSQYNSLFSVSILGGASDKTAITVDGGNVRNSIEGNTGMNFSQEVVQEFQLSSTNFDLSTGITSVGAVNVVTRSGGNQFHGSGYFFFRDHNMAAYPGLSRPCPLGAATNTLCADPAKRDKAENPFFVRRNPGFWVGGPVIKDKLFFFTNYEFTKQTQVFSVTPNLPSVAGLAGNYASPYSGHLFSAKLDWKINANHSAFIRYSHDQNKGFGPNGGAQPQSNWLQNTNYSDQGVIGLTSILKPTIANDFRVNFTYWRNRNLFPDSTVCPGCLGLNGPQIGLQGSNITLGNTSNATQGRNLRRYTFLDTLNWQKGSHRFKLGTELEYAPGTGFWGYCDPACTVAATPEFVNASLVGAIGAAGIAFYFPNLPKTITTQADLLNLPFLGGVVGLGDPAQPPPYNIDQAKKNNRMRFYGQDSWKVTPKFTLNYGLAWNYESTLVNNDLSKPSYLAPLYGSDLTPTNNNYHNFSPMLGFAWNVSDSGKTVVRGGVGIYYDTELLWRRLQERAFIGPVGNGRVQFPNTGFTNIFPGIVDFSVGGKLVPVGASVPSGHLTTMTLGQFLQIYNAQIGAITAAAAPKNLNDLTVRNIQINKSAAQLYPKDYPVQHSYHMNLGVQHQFGRDMVLNVDYVRRVFVNTLLGELDLNRYNRFINGVQTPVIPKCTSAAQQADVNAQCSTGPITFWIPGGRQAYNGVLVKLDKRFGDKGFLGVSYAFTNVHGYNGIANMDQWNSTWGPQGGQHNLNISANYNFRYGIQVGLISSMGTKGPVMPSISNVDLTGDGTTTEPLPGVPYNCFNRGCGTAELIKAVNDWNANYAGKKDARGATNPTITLPSNFSWGDNFSSQDVRVTKFFTWKEHYKLAIFVEMFNVFNIANLGGYGFDLTQPGSFGQPTSRAGQVFGTGGPRAMQLGARVSF